ncbi:uncharacterized protein LOC100904702 [Galendromus occidentalis]|uniref:Uncharacterized protein LOC100904702 n=1 Tax=Galendromus occidentalis TaxID=34638 RepID=A0AAJ6QRC1_9ACAR|nr:uncharacterized protein LOC100904702 [Galendromus occidentalis]
MCKKAQLDTSSFLTTSGTLKMHDDRGDITEPDILLPLATAWIGTGGKRSRARILLDCGSHRSYITTEAAKRIGAVPTNAVRTSVKTMGNVITTLDTWLHRIVISSQHDPKSNITLECIENPSITDSDFPEVTNNFGLLPIADERKDVEPPKVILIVIGAADLASIYTGKMEKYWWIHLNPALRIESLIADNDISQPRGKPNSDYEKKPTQHHGKGPDTSIDNDLKFLWEGEFLGVDSSISDEKDALTEELDKFFGATVERKLDGRLRLSLPFMDNLDTLGDNENLARSRLHSFLKKLKKTPEKLAAVDKEIREYLSNGFAEEALPRQRNQLAHYLPLQAVFKMNNDNSKITKTRVVKDAGARRSHEAALNCCLHQGENLLSLVPKDLIAFRECKFAITADIEKAFLQFEINPSDRTFLRFLWPLGIAEKPDAPIREFWTRVLDFGLICSPWLHIKGVKHHLKDCLQSSPEDQDFITEIADNLNMDDVCFGVDSREEARNNIAKLFDIFQKAHFPLRKWCTSDRFIAEIIEELSPLENTTITAGTDDAKFLGVRWYHSSDSLGVFSQRALTELNTNNPSKRKLLKGLAQIYDPLGIMSPVTVRAEILFQSLWKRKIDWDDILPEDIRLSYEDFVSTLKRCAEFRINRPLSSLFSTASFELHTFCDASLEAYGAVIYLRTIGNNSTESRLIISKPRVVPTKARWSIHRYELMGALMAARMTADIRNFLKLKIDQDTPEKWQPFVANRVREIGKLTSPDSWRYVKSEENPADILSREVSTSGKDIPKTSTIAQSQPFMDVNGILRMRSRLERSNDHSYDQKYPVIIPSEDGWGKLIALSVHGRECWHWGGIAMTRQKLREKYFILKARRIVYETLKTCPSCKRYNAKPAAEPTPPLPAFRVETTPPFLFTGVDFAGPFAYKKENGEKAKACILLFTCAVSRAIALFLTKDLSTYEVLNALQKFINRYPSAKNFVSDNGASFRRADLEIKLIYNHISRGDISSWLTDSKLTWNFISPAAPWVGGFWERMVGCAKRCLKRTLGTTIPYFGDFEVILSGVEAIINQRP